MKIGNTRIRSGTWMALVGSVALVVFVLGFYLPANAGSADLNTRLVQLNEQTAAIKTQIANSRMTPVELEERREELKRQEQHLLAEQDLSKIVRLLSARTRDMEDVMVGSIRPMETRSQGKPSGRGARPVVAADGPVVQRHIKIVLRTRYRSLFKCLEAIEDLPGPAHLGDVVITRENESDGWLTVHLTVCVYTYRAPQQQEGNES